MRQFYAEAPSLFHITVVIMVTVRLKRLHIWWSAQLKNDCQKAELYVGYTVGWFYTHIYRNGPPEKFGQNLQKQPVCNECSCVVTKNLILFIFTFYICWKLAKSDSKPNAISNYLFKPGPTLKGTIGHEYPISSFTHDHNVDKLWPFLK